MLTSPIFLAAADPVQHVINHKTWVIGDVWAWSAIQTNLVLTAIIMIVGFKWIASKIETGPESEGGDRYVTKSSIAGMIEVICLYLRDEMVRPLLRDRTDRMMPFLWTLFFFILINNLLGLIPLVDIQNLIFSQVAKDWKEDHILLVGGTATQSLYVTGALALIAGILINVEAVRRLGIVEYLKHQTGGAPWYVWPIVFPIEVAGNLIIKPVALAIRLFANMTAGHILLAVLIGFVAAVWGEGLVVKGSVSIIAIAGAIAIFFLEIFVAFLQAFIFMFLTTVFISLLDHHGDHEHEAHGAHGAAAAH